MSLEDLTGSSKYISDLVNSNPVGATDPKSAGDDHLRGIKNVILNTFPNIAGAMTASHTELSLLAGKTAAVGGGDKLDSFADGTVMPFFQAAAPTGWTKDASNTDKALRVVSGSGGGTGGIDALSTPPNHAHTGPSHTHTGPSHTHTGPNHTHTTPDHALTSNEMPSHKHDVALNDPGALSTSARPETTTTNDGSVTVGATALTGGGAAHNHGSTGAEGTGATGAEGTGATGSSGTGSTGNQSVAFAPQYVDVILCSKDA